MAKITPERRELRKIVMQAAYSEGLPVCTWLERYGLAHSTYYRDKMPDLLTIYKTCGAAGVKVSEYFRRLGK